MEPTIFLGLVTHVRTRFPESAGAEGLVVQVARHLEEHGVKVVVAVHDDDRHTEDLVPLTRTEVKRSIAAEMALEEQWRSFVNARQPRWLLHLFMAARRAYRTVRLAPPWLTASEARTSGAQMLRRLVNIEIAHLHLLHQARDLEVTWAAIFEDDAHLSDPCAFATSLARFVRDSPSEQPGYVNISRSFSHERLALAHHLTWVGQWDSSTKVMASDIPLTNTVCAILYRGSFLDTLVPALDRIPVSPVLPIDWKLNQALLDLARAGSLGAGDCWFLDPAPVVQGSMHDQGDDGGAR